MSKDKAQPETREIELKLAAPADVLTRLKDDPQWLSKIRAKGSAIVRERLRSTYYDTNKFDLRDKGIALRLRRNGKAVIQTVKTSPRDGQIATLRDEYETRLHKSVRPDPELISDKHMRRKLKRIAEKSPLSPVFETSVERTRHDLRTLQGDQIELAIDIGEIRGRNKVTPIAELELELKSGARKSLYRLARQLVRTHPLRLHLQSKAARGYALIDAKALGAVKARTVSFSAHEKTEDVFETLAWNCLQHLLANEAAVTEGRLPQGVHQMRVALRRLRSLFRLFQDFSQSAEAQHLNNEARIFARRLGQVRDLDVFKAETLMHAKKQIDGFGAGLAQIESAADLLRTEAWDKILVLINTPRFVTFALDLTLFLENKPWRESKSEKGRQSVRVYARNALTQQMKKILKLGKNFDKLDEDERHKLRKRIKKLRYATDFFAGVFDESDRRAYLRKLTKIQDSFGVLNDAATVELLMPTLVRRARDARAQGVTADVLREAQAALSAWNTQRKIKTLSAAERDWHGFLRAAPYWH